MRKISEYIKDCEEGKIDSSLYTSTDDEGRQVIIQLQKGSGAIVSTLHKNGWYEVVDYDVNGFVQGVNYEKA